ncbi:MAG: ROK family transcriptional regulator [Nocardioides sp.]|uniref:ROK family transcriptional regulator n=1 Tax=Nocardioides sp. TaxID=35761 RepID=UPI0039E49021
MTETGSRRRLVEQVVLAAVTEHAELSRTEIARVTGIPRATVIGAVAALLADGCLVEAGPDAVSGRRGRPATRLRLPPEPGLVAVADSSQGVVRLALVTPDGEVSAAAERRYDWLSPGPEWVAECGCLDEVPAVLRMYDELTAVVAEPVRAGAIGVWGPFRPGRGWEDGCTGTRPSPPRRTEGPPRIAVPRHDPAPALAQAWGFEVRSERGPVLRAMGEATAGAAIGAETMLYLQVAEVLAAAIVVEGRPFHGAGGMAGELTHITLGDAGQPCFCGRRGCLGATVGVGYLVDTLRPALGAVGIEDVLVLAAEEDRSVRRAFDQAGRQLGQALANSLALLDADLVVIDADLDAAGQMVAEAFAETVALAYPVGSMHLPRVRVGALPGTSYAVGGAALFRQQRVPSRGLTR